MISATLALLLTASAVADDPSRYGLFLGNDRGHSGQARLLFATADARKMRDLFVDVGGIPPRDAVLVEDGGRRDVHRALADLGLRITASELAGRPTQLVVYYSGHGDDTGLDLGDTRLLHAELREWLEATGADVRIAILDACGSGGALREKGAKGGTRGPTYAFAMEVEEVRGTAFLTSSAATEASQESEELGGSVFTYYLHGGLRGAADLDGDGEVTVGETYAFVHRETLLGTAATPTTQTPSFDLDLSGAGSVWLTRLGRASAVLSFPGDLDGHYAVWDETRGRYIAEVRGGQPTDLAVRPGTYFVHHREPGWVDEAQYAVRDGGRAQVRDADFVSVAYADTASRGDLERQVRKALRPDMSLRLVFGGRGFGDRAWAAQYVPSHAVTGIDARVDWRSHLYLGARLLSGAGPGVLAIADERIDVLARSGSLGATLGVATRPWLVRGGIGLVAEAMWFSRAFPDGEEVAQDSFAPSVGFNPWLGGHVGWFEWELGFSLLLFPVSWDGRGFPAYGETTLALGYRFR